MEVFFGVIGVVGSFIAARAMMYRSQREDKARIALLESQLSEQKVMIEDAGYISHEIKKAEHDLKHHLLCILGTIENGDTEAAEIYLKKLLQEYDTNLFQYIFTDSSAINSILNLKIGRCHANHIDIKTEIESDFSQFSDIDLCVLIANLLDNAIEASCKIDLPQIAITIRNEKNYLCILVKNRINGSVLEQNQHLKTTKADQSKHGFGLYSVSQIVEKYDGIKKYYEKNGYFVADIWLKRDAVPVSEHTKTEANYQTRQN